MLAVKVKQNANGARTWLEIVYARYGAQSHLVFLFFGLMTNIIVSSMLLLGGSAVVNALSGVNIYASNFLIPIGVAFYVYFGGLRATLLCDWSHTTALMVIILYFSFAFYTSSLSDQVGSPSAMWDLLTAAAAAKPVDQNAEGSYLSMYSINGLIFGIINIIGNFGTVFLDQVYFQRAIASRPETAVKAYLVGGLSWFAVPFTFATTMGLGAVALNAGLTPSQVSAGLPAPAAAALLLGKGGAAAMLILLFMAVTSAASAEIIAVSSILTFDVYRTYINKAATAEQMVFVEHTTIAGYAIFMGGAASVLNAIGLSLGWLYLWMGCVIGGGVVPLALTICWSKTSKAGATWSPLIGLGAGLTAWLVTTASLYPEITISTSGENYPMLAGNLVSIGVGGISVLVWTFFKPENYDFEGTRSIGFELSLGAQVDPAAEPQMLAPRADADIDQVALQKAFRTAAWASLILTIILVILIPLTLFGTQYVYSKGFFTGWVVIAIIWTFLSAFAVVLYPIFESRAALKIIVTGMWKDVAHGGTGAFVEPAPIAEKEHGVVSKETQVKENSQDKEGLDIVNDDGEKIELHQTSSGKYNTAYV